MTSTDAAAVRSLGRNYVLGPLLGRGAMGEVYRATDRRTGGAVAAKLLRSEYLEDSEIVGRFVNERTILLALDHPAIVRVLDMVVDGDDLAIVMELVDGFDLGHYLKEKGTLPPAEAADIVICLLDALAAGHQRNVLHRDVKPENVLLALTGTHRVKLTDFSISRLAGGQAATQMTGMVGTSEYMAPEVLARDQVSGASDVYGAGITLYKLLAGRTPFAPGNHFLIGHRHVHSEPPMLVGLQNDLWWLVAGMLAKEPADRPTAAQAAARLRELMPSLQGLPALQAAPVPATWVDVDATLTSAPTLGETQVKGHQRAGDQGPLAGTGLKAPLPLPGAQLLDGTQVKAPQVSRPDVVDVPVYAPATSEKADHKRRNVLLAVATVVVLAAVAGGLVLVLGGSKKGSTGVAPVDPSLTAATVTGQPDTYSGLTVTRSASYDTAKRTATVTVTYLPSVDGLEGPFLESVPGSPCPLTAWTGAAVADSGANVDGSLCGWQLGDGTPGASGTPQTFSYSTPLTVPKGATSDSALTTLLTAESTATTKALAAVHGRKFPVQRITGVQVTLASTAIHVGDVIGVQVLPVWKGDGVDTTDSLYDSTVKSPNQLAAQLGGPVVLTSGCGGAVTVETDGDVIAHQQTSQCPLTATLGKLKDSTSFDVAFSS